jgi:hypothetical protein
MTDLTDSAVPLCLLWRLAINRQLAAETLDTAAPCRIFV